jgi:tetraacyldisaccharide 4'-kinase
MNPRHLQLFFAVGRIFSPFYALLMRLRAWLYQRGWLRREKMAVPVISVGNLTLGGTGKTPLVIYLCRLLQGLGCRPAVLSRGYGRRRRPRPASKETTSLVAGLAEVGPGPFDPARLAPMVVSDYQNILLDSATAGDEPVLLAQSLPGVPVLVAPRRVLSGRYAVGEMGADCLVLDDGFQHLALERDLDLALFSARNLPFKVAGSAAGRQETTAPAPPSPHAESFSPARVFPGGPLREPWSALARADALVITGVDSANRNEVAAFRRFLAHKFPALPCFLGEYLPVCLLDAASRQTLALAEGRDRPWYGFAGIARPESFRQTLLGAGFKLTGFQAFADHYPYRAADYRALVEAAKQQRAEGLITTEKDLVKLTPLVDDLPLLALRIELVMDEAFAAFCRERLEGLIPRR